MPQDKPKVIRLTRAGFEAWLRAKPQSAIVGKTNSACDCPIARYLQETYNPYLIAEVYTVSGGWVWDAGDVNHRPLGKWAVAFVRQVDSMYITTGNYTHRAGVLTPVTKEKALEILEYVVKGGGK